MYDPSDYVRVKCSVIEVQLPRKFDADLRHQTESTPRSKKRRVVHERSPPFRAADVIVSLGTCQQPDDGGKDHSSLPYLVFRFWKRPSMVADYRVSLVLLASDASPSDRDIESTAFSRFPVADVVSVGGSFNDDSRTERALCKGKLAEGRANAIYRFLLYFDGFLPYNGRKGSMGGCCMLSL